MFGAAGPRRVGQVEEPFLLHRGQVVGGRVGLEDGDFLIERLARVVNDEERVGAGLRRAAPRRLRVQVPFRSSTALRPPAASPGLGRTERAAGEDGFVAAVEHEQHRSLGRLWRVLERFEAVVEVSDDSCRLVLLSGDLAEVGQVVVLMGDACKVVQCTKTSVTLLAHTTKRGHSS